MQPSDGMVLVIGPRLAGHSVIFLAIQTHPSCRFLLAVNSLGLRRSGSWSQCIDPPQDFPKQVPGHGDFGQLERDVAAMAHDFGTDLDQHLWQRGQRSVFHFFRQRQSPLVAMNGSQGRRNLSLLFPQQATFNGRYPIACRRRIFGLAQQREVRAANAARYEIFEPAEKKFQNFVGHKPAWGPKTRRGEVKIFRQAGRGAHTGEVSISSPSRATAGIRMSIGR